MGKVRYSPDVTVIPNAQPPRFTRRNKDLRVEGRFGTKKKIKGTAFIFVRDRKILIEKRSADARIDPGKLALPGGHNENGEKSSQTLLREVREELDVTPIRFSLLCRLLYDAGVEFQNRSYYRVDEWRGRMQPHEAENVRWIDIEKADGCLDLEVDRRVVRKLLEQLKRQQS